MTDILDSLAELLSNNSNASSAADNPSSDPQSQFVPISTLDLTATNNAAENVIERSADSAPRENIKSYTGNNLSPQNNIDKSGTSSND